MRMSPPRRPGRLLFLLFLLGPLAGCNGWWHQDLSDYPVFFTPGSAELDQTAQAVIQVAADYAKAHRRQGVVVTGYTDASGDGSANLPLSERRAAAVTDQLVTDGVDRGRIHHNAHGATNVPLSGQADRRVDIQIGG